MIRSLIIWLVIGLSLVISSCTRSPFDSSTPASPEYTEIPPRPTRAGIEIESSPTVTLPSIIPTRETIPVLQLTYLISENDSNIISLYAITFECTDRNPPCLSEPELLFEVESDHEGWRYLDHSWSPDGEYVVLAGNISGRKADLYISDAHGINITNITEDLNGASLLPDWSPLDDEIIFFFCPFENCGIRSIDSKGVRNNPIFISGGDPSWSPDGKRIVHLYSRNLQGTSQIYTADLETLIINQLTYSKLDNSSPDYSPDGNKVVFTRFLRKDRWNQGIDPNLIILDIENGEELQLTSEMEKQYYHPTWSPSGDMIAFGGWILERDVDVYIIRPDGSSLINITNSPEIRESDPAWRLSTR